MDTARLIRISRERAGLSKRELARRAGTSPAAIVKYESGATSPTVDTLDRLLRAAGWEIEVHVARVSQQLVERGEMMHELLGIVDLVDIRPAHPTLEFPRFEDVVH